MKTGIIKKGRYVYYLIKSMSAIPTVVYGFIGVIALIPFIRSYTSSPAGYSLLAVIIILSMLVLPTIVLYILQSFESVNKSIINAALSLGATKAQFYLYILIPDPFKGISIALILGFSRAISDTINSPDAFRNSFRFPKALLESGRGLTSHIALVIPGEFDE